MIDFDIPYHLVSLIEMTFASVECQVWVQNDLSRPFKTQVGLCQGDALSCVLFNLALESIIRRSEVNTRGIIINRSVQILAYANDVDIIARSRQHMTEAFTAIVEAAKKFGFQINAKKRNICTLPEKIGKKIVLFKSVIYMGTIYVEKVEEFSYLGSLVTRINDMSAEIKRRIYLASKYLASYHGLLRLLKLNVITRKTKCKIYETLIRPVLMYGSEIWTLKQSDERLLGIFERRVLRCIYRGVHEKEEWR